MFFKPRLPLLRFLSCCILTVLLAGGCGDTMGDSDEGKTLALAHCGSCHLFPEPSLLPKSIWRQKVLPNMAARMGFPMGNPYKNLRPEDIELVTNAHIIPEKQTLSEADMLKIVAYYENNAPEHPLPQTREQFPESTLLQYFVPRPLSAQSLSSKNILLKSTAGATPNLLMGFEDKGVWLFQPNKGAAKQIANLPAVDARWFDQALYLLDIRQVQAYNLPIGHLWEMQWQNNQPVGTPKILVDSLTRPVSMDVSDLNADGKPDFAIAEFGDYLGRLSLHLSTREGGYQQQVLKNAPGACKVFFRDLNADQRTDLLVLMSQGREEICVFYNTGGPDLFREQAIAAFPPSYGSNALEITDLNRDGHPDILMTNGDNADISSSLKAYHGVRYFENDGRGNFEQRWFYPMHGASAVTAADFDLDGDLDVAALAHFPDFRQKNTENFLFFQNDGAGHFKPMCLPTPLNGRLLALEKLDVDGDGDEDLLIGSYLDQLTKPGIDTYAQWQKEARDCWLLENQTLPQK